jgi:hypothetical protein
MELDDLIEQVRDAALTDEPLDRLSAAMGVKADLDDVTDSLIGHFVDEARTSGCSWTEIGMAMGVSKQAAQQRHRSERPRRERPPWRVGRWTDRAKTAVHEAQRAAGGLGHSYVGTEHLVLGMLAVPQGIAGRILLGAGIAPDAVVAKAAPAVPGASRGRARHIPMTPRANEVSAAAMRNALALGHNYVGTEHLLLGVFDVPEGLGAQVLTEAGMTKADVQAKVIELLTKLA